MKIDTYENRLKKEILQYLEETVLTLPDRFAIVPLDKGGHLLVRDIDALIELINLAMSEEIHLPDEYYEAYVKLFDERKI